MKTLFHWWNSPVDEGALGFHAAEEGHLALGELVDGGGEEGEHRVIVNDAQHVLGHELVLEAVVDELFRPYAAVQEAFDLFYEASFEALAEAAVDAGIPLLNGHEGADEIGLLGAVFCPFDRVLFLVEGDLEGSDKATLGKKRLAVDLAALEKGLAELLDVLLLELGAELRIRRDGGELVGRGDGLDIEPGAAADDGKLALC